MRKLLGPHLGGQWAHKLDVLRHWQPPFILLLQPEVDKVRQLRAACPGTIIVGRFYHEDSYYADGIRTRPEALADEIHNEIAGNPVTPLLDYVQSNNEVCQDWNGIQQLNKFSERWMALADQSQAYKCAILAFSAGNPDLPNKPGDPAGFDGRMLYWQQVLPSLNYAQRNGHILLLHAYGYPDMFHPDADWYIYRYERQVQANLRALGITNLKYAYGEIGIDRLIVNVKGGYKVVSSDQAANDRNYVNQSLQWERDLQDQDLLLGGAIFTFGDPGGWDTYDIASTNVASMIAAHYAEHQRDYESPNVAGDKKHNVFIPVVGTGELRRPAPAPALPPREWDERLTARGVSVVPADVAPGQQFWRVVKACWYDEQESQGRHHIYVDAPAGRVFRVEWPNGSATSTANGKGGFDGGNYPMSKSLNEFSVRMDDSRPSEKVTGIGMGANGNSGEHTSSEVRFELMTMPQAEQPAPSQPPVTQPQPSPVPILAHPVADPRYRVVTQVFGVNGDYYRRFAVDGVPLLGHNGIDFGTPEGTEIVAVDDGWVIESANDPGGFGEYVKLGHAWGESLYAHLNTRNLLDGRVGKGGLVGRSGWTGNVLPPGPEGAHLHFGMRVNPYNRQDGWGGYIDPAPYLINVGVPTSPSAPSTAPLGVSALDPLVLEAIVRTESEGTGFEGGRLKVRVEGHLLIGPTWGNPAAFGTYFYRDADEPLKEYFRHSPNEPWVMYHASQDLEWKALEFALRLDADAALRCISMGAGQVMGFNARRVGYQSPRAMFEAFQRDEIPHAIAIVFYCLSDADLVKAIAAKDWAAIVRGYNGTGYESIYVPRLIGNYDKVANGAVRS